MKKISLFFKALIVFVLFFSIFSFHTEAIVTDVNLVTNPSFETNTGITSGVADGWGKWMSTAMTDGLSVVNSPVSSGTKAQRVAGSNMPIASAIYVLQDLAVAGNKSYSANGRFYISLLANVKVALFIQFFDENNNYLDSKTVEMPSVMNNSYMTVVSSGITPSNTARVRIHAGLQAIGANGSGEFFVDDMSFKYNTDGNILSNPSFDTNTGITNGIADGWGKWKSTTTLTDESSIVNYPIYYGTKAQKVASSNMTNTNAYYVFQDLIGNWNKLYSMSGRFNVESLSNAKVVLFIQFFDVNNIFLDSKTVEIPTSANNNYLLVSTSGVSPANSSRVRIHVGLQATGIISSGAFYVDDMSFETHADTTSPTVPVNFTVASKTNTSLVLTWSPSTDNATVVGYDIYKNSSFVGTATGTTFSVTGVTYSVYGQSPTLNFNIKAKDDSGNSSSSSSILFVTTNPDSSEADDSSTGAIPITLEASYSAFINNSTDADYYRFTAASNGVEKVNLNVPLDNNFDVFIYDTSLDILAAGLHKKGINENVLFEVKAGTTYYMKVVGVNGDNGPVPYSFNVTRKIINLQTDYEYDMNGNLKHKITRSIQD